MGHFLRTGCRLCRTAYWRDSASQVLLTTAKTSICRRVFVLFGRNHSTKVHRSLRYPGEVERILVADSRRSGSLEGWERGGSNINWVEEERPRERRGTKSGTGNGWRGRDTRFRVPISYARVHSRRVLTRGARGGARAAS